MTAAYNFKKRFAKDVERRKKRSTIRARRKNGYLPKAGELISLYTGMRSKGCRLLRRVRVKSVRPITIICHTEPHEHTEIAIDGRALNFYERSHLAEKEGFSSILDFRQFFLEEHGPEAHLYLIEW